MKTVFTLAFPLLLLFFAAQGRGAQPREFRLEDGTSVFPSYRTWEFDVDEPGLYVFDIGSDDGKAAPAARVWLDGVQIGYALGRFDWQAKTERAAGYLRRFRWLEKGSHSLDLYLNVGAYQWHDDMARAMGEKGVRATLMRPNDGEAGFWMPDDCMARVAGEPLVVCGCAAEDGSRIDAETWRRFTMEVCLAGEGTPIWSQTLAIGTKPVRFEYPCDREGAFTYVIKDDKGETVEGPWAFVVTDIVGNENPVNLVNPVKTTSVPPRDPILVDIVDCTEGAGGPHLFREGGRSEIVETPDGAYRRSGPQGVTSTNRLSKFDWFAYTLKVEHPGRSHALVVRVPNDMRHFTSVVAYDRRTGLSSGWSIDSGDAPAAGPWSEMKIPVWPNTDAIDVMVISTDGAGNTHIPHPNRRGAVALLSLFEYPNGFPALEPPVCGWNATREFGWDGEQVNIGPNERTMPPLPDAAAALVWNPPKGTSGPYHDWGDILSTWDRTFELEEWRGGTTLVSPLYSYGMVAFQGRSQMIAPAGRDVYANGCYGWEAERNPFDRDVFALMLQRAEKHGVKVVADFMIQRSHAFVAETWARHCGMDGQTNGFWLVKSATGTPFRTRSAFAGILNPAHPVARKIQIEFCREFGRRYGKYKSFAGINHRFNKGWPGCFEPWFLDGDTGFDDFTVGEFAKATGIELSPVGNDEAAFDARKKRIRAEYAIEWDRWRAEVCRSLHEEMLAALREGAPQARFYAGVWHNVFLEGSGLARLAGSRELGFDAAQARIRGPGVEINGLDPIHFGNFWVHRPQESKGPLPPPRGLCCNSSYRCSPYHLEPAALALADNNLDQLWAGGQWCLPPLDDALRAFVRAYRAIPDRRDWQRFDFSRKERKGRKEFEPVAVWWAKDGDDVLFWAVNRTDASRRVVLTFDKEPSALVDSVTGNLVNPVIPVKKTQSEISLAPFMPGVFRAKGTGSLVGFEVPVDPEETARIEKDFAFIASIANNVAITSAVEVAQGIGETYFASAGALGKRDQSWSFNELFSPMAAAHEAGDLHTLRALVQGFRINHRWWFEAFGWPDDLCISRKVGRKTLASYLDFQRNVRKEEVWLDDTNKIITAAFPQAKGQFVCTPQGVALEIHHHGPPGGLCQLELNALFGGGFGDIRIEDANGKLIGVIAESRANAKLPRLETRILPVPIPNPGNKMHIHLIGTGENGLAIHRLGFTRLPSQPIRDWLVIGPFDKGGGEKDKESYLKVFPPEIEPFDVNAEYTGMGGEAVHWKSVSLGEGERILDLALATPCDISKQNCVSYLRGRIVAKRKRKTLLRYSCDWFGTIWLNGSSIVQEMRGPKGKYAIVEIVLEKGANDILVKTSPGGGGSWHFGLAVDDCGDLEIKEPK